MRGRVSRDTGVETTGGGWESTEEESTDFTTTRSPVLEKRGTDG